MPACADPAPPPAPAVDEAALAERISRQVEARLRAEMELELAARVAAEAEYHASLQQAMERERRATQAEEPPNGDAAEDGEGPAESPLRGTETVWRLEVGGHEPLRGGAHAPVTFVLWSTFDCALCRREENHLEKALAEYGDRVRWVWKSPPSSGGAAEERAAMAVCAAARQDRFWEFRSDMQKMPPGPPDDRALMAAARAAGLDGERFQRDLASEACRRHLEADRAAAARVGVLAAPALFVNGRRTPGPLAYEHLQELVAEELAKAAALEVAGVPAESIYVQLTADGDVLRPLGEDVVPFESTAPSMGSPDAGQLLTVFGDYECPYTAALQSVLAELLRRYPQDLRIEFRPFPLPFHANARTAALAAMEAEVQGRFPAFHEALLAGTGPLDTRRLERAARKAGMDLVALRKSLAAETHGARLDKQVEEAREAGVTGTPTLFLDGRRYLGPDRSLEALVDLVEGQ